MSYNGYLLKVGNYVIPPRYIKAGSLKAKINNQNLNGYTDTNGESHMNVLDFKKPTIEFKIPAPINEKNFRPFMNRIEQNYVAGREKERRVNVSAFYPEKGKTYAIDMYLADPEFVIDTAEFEINGEIIYTEITLKFIAFGGKMVEV